MRRKTKKIVQQLSHSILLQESGSPIILRVIILFLAIIFGFFIYWATNIELNQVVITSGEILTRDDISKIQHPQGGVISKIFVKDGDLVKKGDTLLTFDDTLIVIQIKEEEAKIRTLNKRLSLLQEEMDIKKGLLDKQLTSKATYLTLERNYNESLGDRTQSYYKLEQFRYLRSQLNVVSPTYGYMHYTQSRTIGTIIRLGETIFEIIPVEREYVAELRLSAKDRGQVSVGQDITLKFTSYNYSKYGGVKAKVNSISSTSFLDTYGRPFFKVHVDLPKWYIGQEAQGLSILPGMTLTGDIHIGSKNLLEYLLIPVKIVKDNSFNEQ